LNIYDALVTDPPYECGIFGKNWDKNNVSFSPELWNKFYSVLKPGGFVGACSSNRLYHHMAVAAEDAGFTIYPFMLWKFPQGVPKPANLSELFDRDNVKDRKIIGEKSGSGYTKADVVHGAQNRTTYKFPKYEQHVSTEAQDWRGYYYGVNTILPCVETILIAQKPIADKSRMIDNVREYGTGALNIGALKEKYGAWPNNILEHKKAKKSDHNSDHPSVKPVRLMEDLCLLLCPTGGRILDPFAGTGTTGVAAQRHGFDCVLIEQNPEMEEVIRKRLR
jgi:DNA modification methylase